MSDGELLGGDPRHALIGRSDDVERLLAFVDSALSGGGALVVAGEAGVGKTSVLDVAAARAGLAGARLLRATGFEFEAKVSFAALDHVLASLRRDIELLPQSYRNPLAIALGMSDGTAPDRLLLSNATLELLRLSSAGRSTLIVVDDLQWLDPTSAEVLAFVARRLSGLAVGFLGAARTGVATPFATAGLPQLLLRPLDQRSAETLVATQFPGLAQAVRRRIVDEAQGNPLALIELPASMTPRQRTATDPLPPTLPVSQRLATVFAHRLSELTPQARALLLFAALESSGDLNAIDTAVGVPGGLDPLGAAEELGLVSTDWRTRVIKFRHPLVRAAVVESATEIERRRAHRSLAEALVNQPDRRAWHLSEATVQADEGVADLLEQIGRRCLARGDALGAADAFTRAALLSPERLNRGRRLVEAAYIGATVTGQLTSASRLLEAARNAAPEAADSLRAAIAAANLLLNSECDVDSGHRLLVGAILRYGDHYRANDETLIDALHSLFMICWYGSRAELWEPFDEAMSRIAPTPPALLALCAKTFGDPVFQSPKLLQELDAATAALHDEFNPVTITRIAIASIYADRAGACREALWRVIRDGRQGGAGALSVSAFVSMCVDDWLTGQWDEALDLVAEGVALSRTQQNRRFEEILGGYIRPLILVARGQSHDGLAQTENMAGWAAARGVGMATTFALHVRTLSALSRGDFEDAYLHASTISPPGVLARYTPHALWVLLDLVESAVRTERRAEAAAHVAAMRAADIAAISPRLALISAGCAALAAPAKDADALYEQAIAVPGADRSPFELARVQLAYGQHLRRSRAGEKAQHHLVAALDIFDRLGAVPWTETAADEVRAMGQTTSRANIGARAALLTPQELEIAHLAASGLTNRQIGERLYLSHRTIGAHLYKVYPKLGVTSRAALRDALSPLT